ncbi:MAG TPA: alkaline phosphatase family protein, partial [Kofleriaceae bacterium]|nr:alkaline phosphatase family protein [Kofleriaceae bacterium]
MASLSRCLVLVAAAACGAPGAGQEAPRGRPAVLVTVVIDQFPAWLAEERLPQLPAGGGFARLRREGLTVREMRYAHAATHTGPGHAALYTGLPPHRSGVALDTVFDPRGEEVSAYLDRDTRLVTPDGPTDAPGSSPALLRAATVADHLRAAQPRAFIASVSIKDRGAIFAGGRAPDACLWFDAAAGSFATSTAFAARFPGWARRLGDRRAIAAALSRPWQPLDPAWLRARAATGDDQPGEADGHGLGTVFPHRATGSKAFRFLPAADAAVLGLAAAAAARAPRGAPTLIAVSLSANDYIGHGFGPGSWESWDEWLRLDAALGRFMRELDARFGADGWSMMVTGDHGVSPLPETLASAPPWCRAGRAPDRWGRACAPGHRLLRWPLARRLEETASRVAGRPGPWIAGVIEPAVILTPAARALPPAPRRALV